MCVCLGAVWGGGLRRVLRRDINTHSHTNTHALMQSDGDADSFHVSRRRVEARMMLTHTQARTRTQAHTLPPLPSVQRHQDAEHLHVSGGAAEAGRLWGVQDPQLDLPGDCVLLCVCVCGCVCVCVWLCLCIVRALNVGVSWEVLNSTLQVAVCVWLCVCVRARAERVLEGPELDIPGVSVCACVWLCGCVCVCVCVCARSEHSHAPDRSTALARCAL